MISFLQHGRHLVLELQLLQRPWPARTEFRSGNDMLSYTEKSFCGSREYTTHLFFLFREGRERESKVVCNSPALFPVRELCSNDIWTENFLTTLPNEFI